MERFGNNHRKGSALKLKRRQIQTQSDDNSHSNSEHIANPF
jgi:hypothetical protein